MPSHSVSGFRSSLLGQVRVAHIQIWVVIVFFATDLITLTNKIENIKIRNDTNRSVQIRA